MTLTEFLLARLDADEAIAAHRAEMLLSVTRPDAPVSEAASPFSPSRALRDVEAKRRIVELHEQDVYPGAPQVPACFVCANWNEADYDGPPRVEWPCGTLRLLALPYADHPDYREEWAP